MFTVLKQLIKAEITALTALMKDFSSQECLFMRLVLCKVEEFCAVGVSWARRERHMVLMWDVIHVRLKTKFNLFKIHRMFVYCLF